VIVGIGVDTVDVARFEASVARVPALLARLFADSERSRGGKVLPLHSLAGRFAAKEALIKALGDADGVRWHDMRVVSDERGKPSFELHGAPPEMVRGRGIDTIHLSMTHDGGVATAFVVAEGAAV